MREVGPSLNQFQAHRPGNGFLTQTVRVPGGRLGPPPSGPPPRPPPAARFLEGGGPGARAYPPIDLAPGDADYAKGAEGALLMFTKAVCLDIKTSLRVTLDGSLTPSESEASWTGDLDNNVETLNARDANPPWDTSTADVRSISWMSLWRVTRVSRFQPR